MKKFLLLFIYSLCFSEDINKLYSEAQDLENKGNYKEAMLLYKKIRELYYILSESEKRLVYQRLKRYHDDIKRMHSSMY